tara:strand:+ start:2624 stop:2899 length:276 start_codon:yes stop_codon:yes gene_type:complete
MSETVIVVKIGEKTYHVDPTDINGLEWRDVKKETGLSVQEALEAASTLDMEAMGAIVWIVARRENPDLTMDDILLELTLGSIVDEDVDEGN